MQRGYQKKHRIRKRPEFLQLASDGKRVFCPHFIGVYAPREYSNARLGVTVTKKIGSAVTRNRIKRVCREFFRTHRDQLPAAYDINIIARSIAAQAANNELNESLEELFSQIK